MKLCELLSLSKEVNKIIVNNKYALGVSFSSKFNCFVWCDKRTGKPIVNIKDPTGEHRVILSLKLLERDDWYLKSVDEDSEKSQIYLTNNGMVVDTDDFCTIIKSNSLGIYGFVELNKRKGTIEYIDAFTG